MSNSSSQTYVLKKDLSRLGGMEPGEVGIIWLDAHGDFKTPETPPGGLTIEQVEDALHLIQEQHHIGACAITAYAPELDQPR